MEGISGIGQADATLLKEYCAQRQAVIRFSKMGKLSKRTSRLLIDYPLCEVNLSAFRNFTGLLQLRGYSSNTIRTYAQEFHLLLRLLKKVNVSELEKNRCYPIYYG